MYAAAAACRPREQSSLPAAAAMFEFICPPCFFMTGLSFPFLFHLIVLSVRQDLFKHRA